MNKPLIPAQRRERIQEYLVINKIARIADLSEILDASEATIRRDLERLEKEGLLERTHGGAVFSQRIQLEQEYEQRAQRFPAEKRQIGAMAASMIEDGDIIFINSGTTTTQILRHIKGKTNITIVTNNLIATLESSNVDFELFLIGGEFKPTSNSVAGRFAIDNLKQIYANKAFIGVDGISLKFGCTVPSNAEAEVIHLMLERTHGPISILADHSKWGVVSPFEIAQIDQVTNLITDSGFASVARDELADRSIEVIIADD